MIQPPFTDRASETRLAAASERTITTSGERVSTPTPTKPGRVAMARARRPRLRRPPAAMSIVPQRADNQMALRHSPPLHQPGSDAFETLGLTSREREVLYWITEGKRDREIACIIGVSARTAQNHVANILHKLSVETRTAAARIGLERALRPQQPHRRRHASE